MTNNYSSITNSTNSVPNQIGYPNVQYAQQPQSAPQNIPIPSANGVNIVIYNPQVTPNANVSNIANYPIHPQTYPQNYYTMQSPDSSQQAKNQNEADSLKRQETAIASTNLNINKTEVPEEKVKEEKLKTREVIQLTDDYLKMLETYLDNQDYKIRAMGVKELMHRFAEDDTRKADIGLTALLNKALQDPKDSVRFVAMTIINAGYATGDDLTQKLLSDIYANNGAYGDDQFVASEIRLKTAGNKVSIADTYTNPEKTEKGDKK